MKRNTTITFAILIMLAAGIIWLLRPQAKPPDEQQIRTILEGARQAVVKKNVQGCMQHVSRNYQDDMGFRFDTLRLALAHALRSGKQYDIVFNQEPNVSMQGETATADLNLTVVAHGEGGASQPRTGSLTLTFEREQNRRHLFIPDTVWRVTRASGLTGWSDLAE